MQENYDSKTIAELIDENFERSIVFEKFHIDYIHFSDKTLAAVCVANNIKFETMLELLYDRDMQNPGSVEKQLRELSLIELVDDLLEKHHTYLRRELPALDYLMEGVIRVNGEKYGELHAVRRIFEKFKFDLEVHLGNGEYIFYPLCRQLDCSETFSLAPCKGCIEKQIDRLISQHADMVNSLNTIRNITNDYTRQENISSMVKIMLENLDDLTEDLHKLFYKEKQYLYPKAIAAQRCIHESTEVSSDFTPPD